MRNTRDVTSGALLALIGVAVIVWSFRLQIGTIQEPQPGFFPLVVGSLIVVLSLVLAVRGWLGRGDAVQAFHGWRRPSIMVVSLALYAAALEPMGYIPSTVFISVIAFRILGLISWVVSVLSSVALSVICYVLFVHLLGVELPAGIMFE
jgi:hypothetical protein